MKSQLIYSIDDALSHLRQTMNYWQSKASELITCNQFLDHGEEQWFTLVFTGKISSHEQP